MTIRVFNVSENTEQVIDEIAPSFIEPETEYSVRKRRDQLLSQSDWTQVLDAPVDRDAWAIYRQQLRDVTEQTGFPENVIWPTPPS